MNITTNTTMRDAIIQTLASMRTTRSRHEDGTITTEYPALINFTVDDLTPEQMQLVLDEIHSAIYENLKHIDSDMVEIAERKIKEAKKQKATVSRETELAEYFARK